MITTEPNAQISYILILIKSTRLYNVYALIVHCEQVFIYLFTERSIDLSIVSYLQ